MRYPNTSRHGHRFSPATVEAVWQKGAPIPNYDARLWRRDVCGAVMRRDQHGNTSSQHGWEVDHMLPVARGGRDELSNLQPLQWENNRHKGDHTSWTCAVGG